MHPDRVNVINVLQLIADLDAQKEYERTVPIADVPSELQCQWFDDSFHPDHLPFRSSFFPEEWEVLMEFHNCYDLRSKRLPDTLEEMHVSSAWLEVVNKANWVLDKLGWRGVEAKYDDI